MQILNQGPFTQNFGMQEEKERKVLGNFFTPKNTPPKVKNSKLDKRLIFWDTLQLYLAIYQSLAGHLHFAISNQLSLASNLCISQLEIKLQKSLSLAISGNHQPVITSNPLHSLAIPGNSQHSQNPLPHYHYSWVPALFSLLCAYSTSATGLQLLNLLSHVTCYWLHRQN